MLRDKIIFSVDGKLQQILLREEKLTLSKTAQICQAYEMANKNTQELQTGHSLVNKMFVKSGFNVRPDGQGKTSFVGDCRYCGREHQRGSQYCPAYGKTCHRCRGRNHFKNKCTSRRPKIHELKDGEKQESVPIPANSDDDDDAYLHAVNGHLKTNNALTALSEVNQCKVRFQIDTGAQVNTICQKLVRKEQVRPTSKTLIMWNKTNVKPVGETLLEVINPKTKCIHSINFIVVKNSFNCLLGLSTVQTLNLVTVNDDCFIAKVKSPTDEFSGDLGSASLTVEPNVSPKILPSRKIPLALQDKVKAELDTLVQRNVISLVDEPTP